MTTLPIRNYRVAGGVVLDKKGRVLLIERDVRRNGRMVHEIRLPKGKLDEGETDEEAALREVGEETGYWKLEILDDLGEDQSEFDRNNKHIVRDERYFLMRLTSDKFGGQKSASKEEALFKPIWLRNLSAAQRALTYESEKQWVRRAMDAVEDEKLAKAKG